MGHCITCDVGRPGAHGGDAPTRLGSTSWRRSFVLPKSRVVRQRLYGPNLCRYSIDDRNALTISALMIVAVELIQFRQPKVIASVV